MSKFRIARPSKWRPSLSQFLIRVDAKNKCAWHIQCCGSITPNPLLSVRVQLVAFGSEHILSYPTAATLQYAKNVEEFLMPNSSHLCSGYLLFGIWNFIIKS